MTALRNLLVSILNGFSQIFLQESWIAGLLIAIGIGIGNILALVAALLAIFSSTIISLVFGFSKENIQSGLYGFSPALVGVALLSIFQPTILLWILVVLGGVLAGVIQHYCIVRKLPVFTLPFILITWFLYVVSMAFSLNKIEVDPFTPQFNFFQAGIRGFGEVVFQSNFLSGVLILLGLMFAHFRATIVAFLASFLSVLIMMNFEGIQTDNALGLFGFNVLLTTMVFEGNSKFHVIKMMLGFGVTLFFHLLMYRISNAFQWVGGYFTLPFVLGTWCVLWLDAKLGLTQNK